MTTYSGPTSGFMLLAMCAISASVNGRKPQFSDQASLKIAVTVSNSSR